MALPFQNEMDGGRPEDRWGKIPSNVRRLRRAVAVEIAGELAQDGCLISWGDTSERELIWIPGEIGLVVRSGSDLDEFDALIEQVA